jgi:hypothetical protein
MKNEIIDDLNALVLRKRVRLWEPFMRKYNCQVVCELGVRKGWNFEQMIEHNPKEAVAVDIWRDDSIEINDMEFSQEQLDDQYARVLRKFGNKPFVKVYRELTTEAAKRFPDEYFDFIYVDANHTYEGTLRDIEDWYPKVKKGGFLMGDDFKRHVTRNGITFGVIDAVIRFCHVNDLSFFKYTRHQWGMIKV